MSAKENLRNTSSVQSPESSVTLQTCLFIVCLMHLAHSEVKHLFLVEMEFLYEKWAEGLYVLEKPRWPK